MNCTVGYNIIRKTLVKGQTGLDVKNYSFSQKTINQWNTLSADSVQERSGQVSS